MIRKNKPLNKYTDDEIKEVRATFRKYESNDFKIYKAFAQGIGAMKSESSDSCIEDIPGYIKMHEDDFAINGDSTIFCKHMMDTIQAMLIDKPDYESNDHENHQNNVNDENSESVYGNDNRPGRAQRRRNAALQRKYKESSR